MVYGLWLKVGFHRVVASSSRSRKETSVQELEWQVIKKYVKERLKQFANWFRRQRYNRGEAVCFFVTYHQISITTQSSVSGGWSDLKRYRYQFSSSQEGSGMVAMPLPITIQYVKERSNPFANWFRRQRYNREGDCKKERNFAKLSFKLSLL